MIYIFNTDIFVVFSHVLTTDEALTAATLMSMGVSPDFDIYHYCFVPCTYIEYRNLSVCLVEKIKHF